MRSGVQGEPVALPPHQAVAIAMVLHELATNAAKYGALLSLSGQAVERRARKGLGTLLIEQSLAYDLEGSGELRFERGRPRRRAGLPRSAERPSGDGRVG